MLGFARTRRCLPLGAAVAASLRVVYGGSVNPANAARLFAEQHIDGGIGWRRIARRRDVRGVCEAAAQNTGTKH